MVKLVEKLAARKHPTRAVRLLEQIQKLRPGEIVYLPPKTIITAEIDGTAISVARAGVEGDYVIKRASENEEGFFIGHSHQWSPDTFVYHVKGTWNQGEPEYGDYLSNHYEPWNYTVFVTLPKLQ